MNIKKILTQENYPSRYEFETTVKNCLINEYKLTKEMAEIAFNNCMGFDYAIVEPISEEHPYGVIIATNIYRTEIKIIG